MTDLLTPVEPATSLVVADRPRSGLLTDRPRSSLLTVGLDLTALGVHHTGPAAGVDEPRTEIDLGRVRDLARLAERGGVDFLAFEDDFALAPGAPRTSASRLDAARVSCRLAPETERIGLVATLDTSYLDPVHVGTAIGTLHGKSQGRAGWQVGASQARLLGHTPDVWDRLAREVRRVVGSWPGSDGPAWPFGGARPLVVVRVDSPLAARLAGAVADVARIEALDAAQARVLRTSVREAAARAGRDPDAVRVLVDLVAVISRDAASARFRRDIIGDLHPGEPAWLRTLGHLGGADQLADLLEAWFADRVVDGFTVIPGSVPHDVRELVGGVLPALEDRGLIGRA